MAQLIQTQERILNEKSSDNNEKGPVWTPFGKFWFRTFFIFFFILTVPLDVNYYTNWFTTDWANIHIRDMGKLSGSGFNPIKVLETNHGAGDIGSIAAAKQDFWSITSDSGNFGLASYINWGLAFVIGVFGAVIWTLLDKKSRNYQVLYYFITVAVSFSMLMKLEGLTFSKVFPTQMPALAETQLNTPFGDFVAQKLYWIQLSFTPGYESFIGIAELLIMLLLFFRPTRAIGAALALLMIGNIAIANHVYDGGIHLAASFYALGGTFVLFRYFPNIWNLLIKEQDVTPAIYSYPFSKPWEKYTRLALKVFIFGFSFILSGYLHWYNYKHDSYKVPGRPGLANSKGFYNVSEFKLNGKDLPYSPVDPLRWREVTFENHSTISFNVHDSFMIHGEAGRGKQFKDVDRTYESAGTGGGRRHWYYEADEKNKTLTLFNKNKVYKDQKIVLKYERPTDNKFILSGKNEQNQDIYVVLDKVERQYPIYEGRRDKLAAVPF